MKPDYEITNNISEKDRFFYLFNFEYSNKISIYGFYSERILKMDYLVGVWKIKKSNETNI